MNWAEIHPSLTAAASASTCASCSGECRGLEVGGCTQTRRILRALWAMLSADSGDGWFEVRLGAERRFISARDVDAFVTTIAGAGRLAERVRVGTAVRSSIDEAGEYCSRVLWVRLEKGDAIKQLERFQPRPTMILRDGDNIKRTAFWELSKPLQAGWVEQANERLSHRLKGIRADADPGYMFAPPFAPLARGKHVVVEHFMPVYYRAAQVVGDDRPDRRALPPAPDRDAWRQTNEPAAMAA